MPLNSFSFLLINLQLMLKNKTQLNEGLNTGSALKPNG